MTLSFVAHWADPILDTNVNLAGNMVNLSGYDSLLPSAHSEETEVLVAIVTYTKDEERGRRVTRLKELQNILRPTRRTLKQQLAVEKLLAADVVLT